MVPVAQNAWLLHFYLCFFELDYIINIVVANGDRRTSFLGNRSRLSLYGVIQTEFLVPARSKSKRNEPPSQFFFQLIGSTFKKPSINAISRLSSRSEAAPITPLNWPGRRAPTIAAVTAGFRKVQAMATSPAER